MDNENNVFYSKVTRVTLEQKNNLYDLLDITPAKPQPVENTENDTSFFEPRRDKYYVPKKRSGLKVRTVRDIRYLFEHDNYSYIIENMEKQQDVLLSKIRTGSATDDTTKNMAKKLLNANHPISRTAWQILNNINPERNINPTQFVLLNGKRIRVVGSKGGKTKFVCNHDLNKNNIEKTINKISVGKKNKKKRGLLRNSLSIKFKPGPLQRKKILDDSHQKYNMGPIELTKLPKPGLDIQPAYGIVVEPIMSHFINKLRPEDGTITKKWAEFTVTALGTVQNNVLIQTDKECCVTFDLSYKCGQNRILMRRDINNVSANSNNDSSPNNAFHNDSDNMFEIENTMQKMLNCVEISLMQDSMYTAEIETPLKTAIETLDDCSLNTGRDKNKKKYGELDRLDVTVIQLPGKPIKDCPKPCGKSYCNLGCMCDSLNCTYKLKQHCGYFECMFGCKCEMSLYTSKNSELLDNGCAELIPGLIKLDNEINANLSKEEQKFHQTVVMSGEKSILLKSRKRNLKSSTNYAEFYSNMRLNNDINPKKILIIKEKKLNCSNIEPWCMVHNLYKCFCSGRFTETSALNTASSLPNIAVSSDNPNNDVDDNCDVRHVLRPRARQIRKSLCSIESNVYRGYNYDNSVSSCARTNGYSGQKYNDSYYKLTNNKISEMEKNNKQLQNKMLKIMNVMSSKDTDKPHDSPERYAVDFVIGNKSKEYNESSKENPNNDQNLKIDKTHAESLKISSIIDKTAKQSPTVSGIVEPDLLEDCTISTELTVGYDVSGDTYKPIQRHLITQEFLTPWIAKSYKNYKQQLNNRKSTLARPRKGLITLHLWECLLNRYRNRRNIFLTTTKRPFRIYIATEIWKPFFKECINIDAIRFADLNKYPSVVKKLLTNVSNKDYFCILGGWDDCWEIIGSVKKHDTVNDDLPDDTDISNAECSSQDSDFASGKWCINEQNDAGNSSSVDSLQEIQSRTEINNLERSKWFLMKLESDFTDIKCHKKGFYVEREKIIHAINLARGANKTVLLNKQTNSEITNIPFGIYALPIMTEFCAVVGPYEMDEALGLEIVKPSLLIKQKSTKGFWITTNKVDNLKVLDDPMAFLPTKSVQKEPCDMIGVKSIPSNFNIDDDSDYINPSTSVEKGTIKNQKEFTKETTVKKKKKTVKPIKIRRTNGFYHLTSNNSIIKNILNKKGPELNTSNPILINNSEASYSKAQIINSGETIAEEASAPVEPESATSQIKITSIYSENENKIMKRKNTDNNTKMFILKPEEINKKATLLDEKICTIDENEIAMDIDNFLTSPEPNKDYENDCLVISDADDTDVEDVANDETHKWTDVWIQCSNINNLGWINAKRNQDNLFRINLPGIKPTHLYKESEALEKIHQVMASQLYVPDDVKLQWQICNKKSKNGKVLRRAKRLSSVKKTTTNYESHLFEDPPNTVLLNEKSCRFEDLEETSRLLEDKSVLLLNETENRREDITRAINVPEELRSEISGDIQTLKIMNDELVD